MKRAVTPFHFRGNELRILDQRELPFRVRWIRCRAAEDAARAIKGMAVRGAPAIGIAAAYGAALEARRMSRKESAVFERGMRRALARLARTRPTAVNLFFALDRMRRVLAAHRREAPPMRALALRREAERLHGEDAELCRCIGRAGAPLLARRRWVYTHCNTGALATGGEGTALAMIREAARRNPRLRVWVGETRPYLQGARLTAFELSAARIPFRIVTDSTAGSLMAEGRVDAVVVGADRIVANGDIANKIGTYSLAVLARHHGVPFFVAAPTSSFDLSRPTGKSIPLEERDPREVTEPKGLPLTRGDYPALHRPFDVTPACLIDAVVCEAGICRPPFHRSLRRALAASRRRKESGEVPGRHAGG